MSDAVVRLAFGGLHPTRLVELVDRHGGAAALVRAIERGGGGVSDAVRARIRPGAPQRHKELAEAGIEWVVPGDGAYPVHLEAVPEAPPGLFVRGDLPSQPGVAVVGTRTCSRYGLDLARAYGRAIARAGWPLMSGLARGIDGAAHTGTVESGGVGVAVLGCGVDVAYPRSHAALAADLLRLGGAIVSEYPPGAPPRGWRFPPRNRIISGLSRAVVVVEAGVKGGALITARLALEQGITVFAVPGDVQRESSRGCNLLIRDGAHPVLDPDDLVEELSLVLGPPRTPAAAADQADHPHDPVLESVRAAGAMAVDVLADRLDVPISGLLAAVARLEAAGVVEFDGATVFANGH